MFQQPFQTKVYLNNLIEIFLHAGNPCAPLFNQNNDPLAHSTSRLLVLYIPLSFLPIPIPVSRYAKPVCSLFSFQANLGFLRPQSHEFCSLNERRQRQAQSLQISISISESWSSIPRWSNRPLSKSWKVRRASRSWCSSLPLCRSRIPCC